MHSVLIVEPSDDFRIALKAELKKKYHVLCCITGAEGLKLLNDHLPSALILNLMLEDMDGLRFLETAGKSRPSVIISLSASYPPYVMQSIKDLGVGFPIMIPCTLYAITKRLDDMLNTRISFPPIDHQNIVSSHLRLLSIPYLNGYQMLRVGVPLFAQDRTQFITKELYPAIATLCNCDNWQQVESAIREVIKYGWENRDEEVWKQYFVDTSRCPTNKDFIYRLSEFIDL